MSKYVLTLSFIALFSGCATTPEIPLGELALTQQIKDCLNDKEFTPTDYYINRGHRMPTVEGRKLMVTRKTSKVMPSGIFCEVTDVTNWGRGIQ
jgi:hypothetical protein